MNDDMMKYEKISLFVHIVGMLFLVGAFLLTVFTKEIPLLLFGIGCFLVILGMCIIMWNDCFHDYKEWRRKRSKKG